MNKKLHNRMCVVCRNVKAKEDFLRVVKTNNGILIDNTGKIQGRGAYICKDDECIDKAIKTKAFNRVFKCNIEGEFYDMLKGVNTCK